MNRVLKFFATGRDAPLIEDQTRVSALYKKHRWRIMTAITFGYGIAYTCRLALSVVKKPLIDGGIFNAQELGLISSAIFYSYAFGKLTNGFLADHANLKRFLSFGILMSALINIAMGWTPLLWVWVVLWALNGWFQGIGAPSAMVSITNWFSNNERGRWYGFFSMGHPTGEGLTYVVIAGLVTLFGWRAGFMGPGLTCVAVAFIMHYLLQDRPKTLGLPLVADWRNDHGAPVVDTGQKAPSVWSLQKSILKLPSIWILALASSMMYVTRYAVVNWGILFLQETKGYSLVEAGSLLGLNTIAGLIGSLSYGYISDKFFHAKRPPVTLICGLLELLALSIIFLSPLASVTLLSFAFILYGFSISGLLVSLGGLFATDIAPKKAAGAAMGIIGVFSYLGAATQDLISGYFIEKGTTIVDGVRHYDFSSAIIFWVGASVLSLILATSLWKAKVSD
ncbi:MAG: MFS transporter [Ignavibacteriales bacterium]|nr:MFS transporter [Ignavibacteriales bacterium]